jgi:tetratricopeptide (TPR) repeat protein
MESGAEQGLVGAAATVVVDLASSPTLDWRVSAEVDPTVSHDLTSPISADAQARATEAEALRAATLAAIERGDVETALELVDASLVLAREGGDPTEIDRAICERAAALVELGRASDVLTSLRELLVRSDHDLNCCRAAYTLARAHELEKSFRKALFYAQAARDRAERTDEGSWRARCHNELGNILIAESHLEPAAAEYERALELIPAEQEVWAAHIWDNLGYCRVIQGRHREGFGLLFRALRTFRRHRAAPYELEARVDLSFAYLEIERPVAARRHAEIALQLAGALGDQEARKNALYLAGQAALLAGERDVARLRFGQLGSGFFPELPGLESLLLEVDVRHLVNLKA